MIKKKEKCKSVGKRIFKTVKACGSLEKYKEKFTCTDFEKDCYNRYYWRIYGKMV